MYDSLPNRQRLVSRFASTNHKHSGEFKLSEIGVRDLVPRRGGTPLAPRDAHSSGTGRRGLEGETPMSTKRGPLLTGRQQLELDLSEVDNNVWKEIIPRVVNLIHELLGNLNSFQLTSRPFKVAVLTHSYRCDRDKTTSIGWLRYFKDSVRITLSDGVAHVVPALRMRQTPIGEVSAYSEHNSLTSKQEVHEEELYRAGKPYSTKGHFQNRNTRPKKQGGKLKGETCRMRATLNEVTCDGARGKKVILLASPSKFVNKWAKHDGAINATPGNDNLRSFVKC